MEYEVIIDFESKHIIIDAVNEEIAKQKGIIEFEKNVQDDPTPNYWVGECNEVE